MFQFANSNLKGQALIEHTYPTFPFELRQNITHEWRRDKFMNTQVQIK